MQEEVENRTVTLTISGAKLTGRTLKWAIRQFLNHHSKSQAKKAQAAAITPRGKQSVAELVGQNQGVQNIEISDKNIKDFDRVARKYGIDYNWWKNHEPKILTEFRSALKTYIDAIRNGNMDLDKINTLMKALEALKQHKDYEKICIQLTAEDLEVLVGRIYEYTIKLAQDNSVELSDEELRLNNGAIINLQSYLKAQKRIFEAVA